MAVSSEQVQENQGQFPGAIFGAETQGAENRFNANLPIVTAPIVVDAKTAAGVSDLLTYIDSLNRHSNVEVAREENRRLEPYFKAMSAFLEGELEKNPDADKQGELKALTTPGALAGLFNAMAAFTASTLISDVVVMSDAIKTEGPAAHLFKSWGEFNANYDYCGHGYNFGFLQTYEGGKKNDARSGTTFPTFMVDHALVDLLPEAERQPLLKDIQGVMTLVNHDMLHHLTSTYIGGNTVFKNAATGGYGDSDAVRKWSRTLPDVDAGEKYEEWAQMGQEHVLLQLAGAGMVAEVRAKIDHYMDGLERVRDALLTREDPGVSAAVRLQKAHETVDYFGMVMAHALTRVFPLNHEVLQHCLDRLEKADPTPETAGKDCARMLAPNRIGGKAEPTKAEVMGAVREGLTKHSGWHDPIYAKIVKGYRGLGCDVLPEDDAAAGYKNFKMVGLMKLGGLHAHIPQIEHEGLTRMRQNYGDFTLKMVRAAAETSGYKPATTGP